MITKEKIKQVNRVSTALQLEQNDMEREINLVLPADVMEKNRIVAVQWHAAMSKTTCDLCSSLNGRIFPVYTNEFSQIAPPIHINCKCLLSYITAQERGVFARLEKYRPVDPGLLNKWSSKVYTDEMLRKFMTNWKETSTELLNFHANITENEQLALKNWSRHDYEKIRRYWLSSEEERDILELRWGFRQYEQIKKEAESISSLFMKYVDGISERDLYRMITDLSVENFNKFQHINVGEMVKIDKGITSWTVERKIAENFQMGNRHSVMFRLLKKRTKTKELDVMKYSVLSKEKEVLIQNNQFIVTSKRLDKERNLLTITLKEV